MEQIIDKSGSSQIQAALAIAQGSFPTIPKNCKVDVYSKPPERRFLYTFFYADLTAIIDATRPALRENGLSFTQDYDQHRKAFFTTLRHKSGESLNVGYVPCSIDDKSDMKIVAGLYTYGKRISLTAALGISSDEDMDAAAADAEKGIETNRTEIKPKPKNHAPLSLTDQIAELAKSKGMGNAEIKDAIKKATGKNKAAECSEEELMTVVSFLKMK